jgi:hypothetical protein
MEVRNQTRLLASDYLKAAISSIWPGVSEHLLDINSPHDPSAASNNGQTPDGSDLPKRCDKSLEEAASKFRTSVDEVFREEMEVEKALEALRSAEAAYRQVCDNVQQHSHDFSEHRVELELSVSPMKSRLAAADREVEAAMLRLKLCEEVASECLSSLRKAEADLEMRVRNSQRKVMERAVEHEGHADTNLSLPRHNNAVAPPMNQPAGNDEEESAGSTTASAALDSGESERLRAQLARIGISVAANTSVALLRRILAAAADTAANPADTAAVDASAAAGSASTPSTTALRTCLSSDATGRRRSSSNGGSAAAASEQSIVISRAAEAARWAVWYSDQWQVRRRTGKGDRSGAGAGGEGGDRVPSGGEGGLRGGGGGRLSSSSSSSQLPLCSSNPSSCSSALVER